MTIYRIRLEIIEDGEERAIIKFDTNTSIVSINNESLYPKDITFIDQLVNLIKGFHKHGPQWNKVNVNN